jgi:two-component system LytT family response regulator
MLRMLSTAPRRGRYLDRLVLKAAGATHFVRVVDIDWIEAAGVYVTLHIGGKQLLYRASLSGLAENLDPQRFVRVHRSAMVNIDSIVRLEPLSHGEFDLILRNGGETRVSRSYRAVLEQRLGQAL